MNCGMGHLSDGSGLGIDEASVIDKAIESKGRTTRFVGPSQNRQKEFTMNARIRTAAAGLVVALALLVAPATAGQASAAQSGSFCFTYMSPNLPWYGMGYANRPIYVQAYTTAGWKTIATGNTGSNGCGSFTTGSYTNYYIRVVAFYQGFMYGVEQFRWVGYSPNYANPGSASNVYLGDGSVFCQVIRSTCT